MNEKTKEAIAIGMLGGWFYAKLLVFLLGFLMALAWPEWWASLASDHPSLAWNIVRLTKFLLVMVVLGLPFVLALRFLLRERALLGAAALGVTGFVSVHLFVGGWESWSYLRYYSVGMLVESASHFVGPALLAWFLGRTYNMALKRDLRDATRPPAP